MGKRQAQWNIEKDLEYGGIENQQVDPKARARFKAPAYENRKPRTKMPRYTVDTYLASKGHNVKGVIADGQSKGTE